MKWEKVGEISVDAGLCWIGDPCYLVAENIFENWPKFCAHIHGMGAAQQFDHELGNPGLGVLTRTGAGDGRYPVYAEIVNGEVHRVMIDFLMKGEDD